jgi:hypothetical protein
LQFKGPHKSPASTDGRGEYKKLTRTFFCCVVGAVNEQGEKFLLTLRVVDPPLLVTLLGALRLLLQQLSQSGKISSRGVFLKRTLCMHSTFLLSFCDQTKIDTFY